MLKTNKEQVFSLLKLHESGEGAGGISTQYIAEKLSIKRSNVSAILNGLAKEGLIGKTAGRPVLYYAVGIKRQPRSGFENLIGWDGSLRRGVQLAAAAALYPQGSMNIVISGQAGTGKKLFAKMTHRFAVENGAMSEDAPFVLYDCAEKAVIEELFDGGIYETARRGVLVIDNAHMLNHQTRQEFAARTEELEKLGNSPLMILLCVGAAERFMEAYPISFTLPPLSERPLAERKALIESFITLEATRAKRTIVVGAELIQCLMLYDADMNITQLKHDIKVACANAYVRGRLIKSGILTLTIGDFYGDVRKGFLRGRTIRDEVAALIPANYEYRFGDGAMEMTELDRRKSRNTDMYDMIERRAEELTKYGISEKEIRVLLSEETETRFKEYHGELLKKAANAEQLEMLIDARILDIVREFLKNAESVLARTFSVSVLHGLCLHIDATIKKRRESARLDEERIRDITARYKREYALCANLASNLETEFSIELPLDEIVIFTMFICYTTPNVAPERPSLIFAFQGAGLAESYANTINATVEFNNAFGFEVPVGKEPAEYYDAFLDFVKRANRGKGVLVFYDMDFFAGIITSVGLDAGIETRLVHMPLTNIGFELSRRAARETNIDSLHYAAERIMERYYFKKPDAVITLCATGEGGAAEMKVYIERHAPNIRVFALSNAVKEYLREEISRLLNDWFVRSVVGVYDPGLFGLPFVPISDCLTASKEELQELLLNGKKLVRRKEVDYEGIYGYLSEHLTKVKPEKLKKTLPIALAEINAAIAPLSIDTEIGLFLHIPCCVERLALGEQMPENAHKEKIIKEHIGGYRKLIKILRPLEKAFNVIFTDDELATLLTIIYKI